jgi:hypothetical protein
MSLHALAGHMAAKGRGPDSMLVHMTPDEVKSLHAMALAQGGELTINPETGLPEAGFLSDAFKALAPLALGAVLGPAGFGLSATMAGVATGGITALATGSLSRGLMAGMGAYGGAGLAEGLMGAGTGAMAASDIAAQQAAGTFPTLAEGAGAEQVLQYGKDVGAVRDAALSKAGEAGFGAKAAAGFGQMTSNPGMYGKDLLQYGLAAISPMMADQGVQTTTKRSDTGNIRRYSFDPYGQTYTSQGVYPAKEEKGMAQGGIIALAAGGTPPVAGPAAGSKEYNKMVGDWFNQYPDVTTADIDKAISTYGLNPGDVVDAMRASGLSNAAVYSAFHSDVGAPTTPQGGLAGLTSNINQFLGQYPDLKREEAETAMNKWGYKEADIVRATGKSLDELFPAPTAGGGTGTGGGGGGSGVSGGGKTVINPDGSVTTTPNIPGRPEGGFTGMKQLRDIYEQGGGSLGYENPYAKDMEDFNARFNKQTGSSRSAYDYLKGEGEYPTASRTPGLMRPYGEATLGLPVAKGRPTQKYIFQNGRYLENPDFIPVTYDSTGKRVVGVSDNQILDQLKTVPAAAGGLMQRYADGGSVKESLEESRQKLNAFLVKNNVSHERIAALLGISVAEAKKRYPMEDTGKKPFDTNQVYGDYGDGHDAAAAAAAQGMAVADNVGQEGLGVGSIGANANADSVGMDGMGMGSIGANATADSVGMEGLGVGSIGANATADSVGMDGMGSGSGQGSGAAGGGNAAGGAGNSGDGGTGDSSTAVKRGGIIRRMALGGLGALASGGQAGYNLGGYSDGGRLLRGPGDGVSDSIPATIGNRQPARLADGEFVIPARIVSELGNGSTEAGARKLYAMMDRVQKARGKTTGKSRVAANTRSEKYLPA